MPTYNNIGRGDLCAQRRVDLLAKRDERSHVLEKTINALREERTEVVRVPGGRSYLVSVEAAEAIRAEALKKGKR